MIHFLYLKIVHNSDPCSYKDKNRMNDNLGIKVSFVLKEALKTFTVEGLEP